MMKDNEEFDREIAESDLLEVLGEFDTPSIRALTTGLDRMSEIINESIEEHSDVARAIEWAFGNKEFFNVLMQNYERSCQQFPVPEETK